MPFVTTTFVSDYATGSPPVIRTATPERAVLKTTGIQDADGESIDININFPFGPRDVSHDTLETKFVQIARPGKKPILAKQNQQLRTVSFKAVIADKESGGALPIVDILDDISNIAENGYSCKFVYGQTSLSYFVAITKFSYNVKYRNTAGEPIRAEASLQLTEVPSIDQEIAELLAVYRTPTYTKAIPGPIVDDLDGPPPLTEWESDQVTSRFGQLMEDIKLPSDSLQQIEYAKALYSQAFYDVTGRLP